MGFKGAGSRTACIGYQHRSFYLHKAFSTQILKDSSKDFRTLNKCILNILIHNQIHISLAVAQICICKAVELLRKNLKALGKKGKLTCVYGNFSCLCSKDCSFYAYNITDIQLFKFLIGIFPHTVSGHIYLNASLQILKVAERSLAHDALKHHTSCNAYFLLLPLIIMILDLHAVGSYIIFCDLKWILSCCLKLCQLISAGLQYMI